MLSPVQPQEAVNEQRSDDNERIVNKKILDDLRLLGEDDSGEWLSSLIKTYLKSSRGILDELHRAIEQRNAGLINQHAHKLRGSSSNIGAVRINAISELLEQPIKPDGYDEVKKVYARLLHEFDITQRHLEAGYLHA